jgi:hypothetical protein
MFAAQPCLVLIGGPSRNNIPPRGEQLRPAGGLLGTNVLQHGPACFLALPALFGTLFHVRVVLVFLAFVAAPLAGLRTRLADKVGERPPAGNDAGCGGIVGGAVMRHTRTASQTNRTMQAAAEQWVAQS